MSNAKKLPAFRAEWESDRICIGIQGPDGTLSLRWMLLSEHESLERSGGMTGHLTPPPMPNKSMSRRRELPAPPSPEEIEAERVRQIEALMDDGV